MSEVCVSPPRTLSGVIRREIRLRHYGLRTDKACIHWALRYASGGASAGRGKQDLSGDPGPASAGGEPAVGREAAHVGWAGLMRRCWQTGRAKRRGGSRPEPSL